MQTVVHHQQILVESNPLQQINFVLYWSLHEDDFGVSATFRTSREIKRLPYAGIFFRDWFYETKYFLLKKSW